MAKNIILFILLLVLFSEPAICSDPQEDPSKISQILYNGKEWHNLYTFIKGDQFLFSKGFLPASVTVNGKTFKNIELNYDIFNDEIIIPSSHGVVLQLNKELIDSFSLDYMSKSYEFVRLAEGSVEGLSGYFNSLYKGKLQLLVKYKKDIDPLAVDDKYDQFFQTYKIYIVKDGVAYQVSGKKDMMKLMQADEAQVKAYMKKNSFKVSKKAPESFVPVLRYYDSLSH